MKADIARHRRPDWLHMSKHCGSGFEICLYPVGFKVNTAVLREPLRLLKVFNSDCSVCSPPYCNTKKRKKMKQKPVRLKTNVLKNTFYNV